MFTYTCRLEVRQADLPAGQNRGDEAAPSYKSSSLLSDLFTGSLRRPSSRWARASQGCRQIMRGPEKAMTSRIRWRMEGL